MQPGPLEQYLRDARSAGRKLLVAYITAGTQGWELAVETAASAGADAIEIGIPFSDPVMDGPIIQKACTQALAAGTTPSSVLEAARDLDAGVPLVVMTYYNLCHHMGEQRFAEELAAAGIAGAILPDLPLTEAGSWLTAGLEAGIETTLLAASTTPDGRLAQLCEASRGFVYAVSLLGVTGERKSLAQTAKQTVARCKAVTDKPVLCGVGIGSPEQAVEACEVADGVVIGSAVVRAMLEASAGASPAGASPTDANAAAQAVEQLITTYRKALDERCA